MAEKNVVRCALPPDPTSPARARSAVSEALRDSHSSQLCDDAMLLVSEVVTNAVVHAGTPLRLLVHDRPHMIRVEVEDASVERPVRRHSKPRSRAQILEGGRGIELLERVADAWGVESRRAGKAVWFELVDVDAR